MSVQSRIRKIEKKKRMYKRRKEDIIRLGTSREKKELTMEEIAKKMGLKI